MSGNPLILNWIKCNGDVWCSLEGLDCTSFKDTIGAYVIWHPAVPEQKDAAGRVVRAAIPARVVRVGQGDIKDRIAKHRKDDDVMEYAPLGLYVTWATVPAPQLGGVEAFLAARYTPLVGERFPDRQPIPVNLPQ